MITVRLTIFLFLAVVSVKGISKSFLYPHGAYLDTSLPPEDEVSSQEIPVSVPIIFYGEIFDSIYVNSNGLLSFQTDMPNFFNLQFPLDYPAIAPLYTNVDIRSTGTISYRESKEPEVIARASNNVRQHFRGHQEFKAQSVFIATWLDVGYHNNKSDKKNSFQVAIVSDGQDSFVEFLYPEGGIEWIQGTGGDSGLPDARAQAGFVGADGRYYTLKGSGTDQVQNLDKWTNVRNLGQWVFHIGSLQSADDIKLPDINGADIFLEEATSCLTGSTQCHSRAKCIDYEGGFCCECNEYFYGNGKTCLKNDVPLRVNGKVSGKINEVEFNLLDLQSYIVMSDGRAYTAISKIPANIGYDSQSIQILGGTIGWLFAKPVGATKNGYEITGGQLTHTAQVIFPDTDEQVIVVQKYLGLDVFDQLRVEIDVRGTVPKIPPGAKLTVPDYEEQFTYTSSELLESHSSRTFLITDSNVTIPFNIHQKIEFKTCSSKPQPEEKSFRIMVTKIFINYEQREQIVRFGVSDKVHPMGDFDPCKEGHKTCGKDSVCIPDGDSFKCVCHPGFQYIYNGETAVCVDINECQSGTNNCDFNARCINEVGGYTCACNPGFEGDGISCKNTKTCADLECGARKRCLDDDGARCVCSDGYVEDRRGDCVPDRRRSCEDVFNCSEFGMCTRPDPTSTPQCVCMPQYEGNGYECVPKTEGEAEEEYGQANRTIERCLLGVCWCPEGYEKLGDSFYCVPKRDDSPDIPRTESYDKLAPRPLPMCFENSCSCPTDYDYIEELGICKPKPGLVFDTKGGRGRKASCNEYNNCHREAQCIEVEDTIFRCICNEYFEGDGYSCKEEESVSCTEADICHIRASCVYNETRGKSVCVCDNGYEGNGYYCNRQGECSTSQDCPENEECLFSTFNNHNECLCKEGYERDADNHCHQLLGICGGGTCVENAECLYDENYKTHYCQCGHGFVGDGITECKPRPVGCDVMNNCGLHASCEYDQTENYYMCKCSQGFYGDGFICTPDRNCHVDPYICDVHASCVISSDRRYVCQCNSGFTGNGTVCKVTPKHEGNFLMLTQGMAVIRIPFDVTPKNPGKPIQFQYNQMAIGLDIDCFGGRVYWSDIAGKTIKSAAYNGTGLENFIANDIGSPEGVTIDWVSRNIYWTDSQKDTIEVANIDTKLRKVLVSTGLVNPRGIVVHPRRGKMFWSDWNREAPKIEWANMDGSGRQVFLQGRYIQLPNSMAIDWETDNVCFADAGTKNIECINIDTREIRTIAVNCTYPFGLAISDKYFYWTDWVSEKVESVDKLTLHRQKPMSVPLGGSGVKLYGLAAVPEQCEALSNMCQFYNGQCSPGHLCLPSSERTRSCVCAVGKPNEPALCNDLH